MSKYPQKISKYLEKSSKYLEISSIFVLKLKLGDFESLRPKFGPYHWTLVTL